MRKLSALIFFIVVLVFFFFITPFVSAKEPLDIKTPAVDQIMVRFRPGLSSEERLKFHRIFGEEFVKRFDKLNADLVRAKDKNIADKVSQLLKDPRVEAAEPNYIATALELSNDPYVLDRTQWGLFNIQAAGDGSSGWNYSKSNPKIPIAVVDTGIDSSHADLSGKVINSHSCTDSSDANDYFGHGTHVAGIAAAATNNGSGIGGVGYNASLLNAKSLSDEGWGYYSWIADCIIWSADNGAKVINMSLGGSYPSKILEEAVNYAWSRGVVIVAAAGNSGNSLPLYPAYFKNVISVAAVDKNDKKPWWSSYGRWVDVAAPGAAIFSTLPTHDNVIGAINYGFLSGTSMATPHVSGLAALVWSSPYGFSNSAVRDRIQKTADRISGTGNYWKYGRINALTALKPLITGAVPTKVPAKSFKPNPFYIQPISPLDF